MNCLTWEIDGLPAQLVVRSRDGEHALEDGLAPQPPILHDALQRRVHQTHLAGFLDHRVFAFDPNQHHTSQFNYYYYYY